MNGSADGSNRQPVSARPAAEGQPAGSDRYSVALDAALEILETVDTLPKSNRPVRLAKVIGIVLDAIYESEGAKRP